MMRGYRKRISSLSAVSLIVIGTFAIGTFAVDEVSAQCILSNPSFETTGSGGAVFQGWNQFGIYGSTTVNVPHGLTAARLTGPNLGGWDVSGYWQRLDSQPGDQWTASVCAWHTPTNPLTGQSKAILNIEWHDGSGALISFESHDVMTAATPTDEVQFLTVTSGAAPAGTASIHFLLGVLQSPTDPPPDIYYDISSIYAESPTHESLQWGDFPAGRTINFSGRTWRVKGSGFYGPGPNSFNHDVNSVWVTSDQLHVSVKNLGGTWYSSEVVLEEALGYGDYIFTTEGRLDLLHENVILGLFLWEYGPCYDDAYTQWNAFNEIDVEFSRWGNPGNEIGQFVTQPWYGPSNMSRFDATFSNGELTSHAIKWLPDRVEYRSWRGGPGNEGIGAYLHQWTYVGPHIPRPEQPRVHINLWQLNNNPPSSDQTVVLDEFTFVPECVLPHCDPLATGVPDGPMPVTSRLFDAVPNPFNPATTIGYVVEDAGFTELIVYDVVGRRVRTLVSGVLPAGSHEVVWRGRDDNGGRVASGVYLYQLRSNSLVETKKLVLLK
jgi:hypothetical protein